MNHSILEVTHQENICVQGYIGETEKPIGLTKYKEVFKKTGLKFKPQQLDICHKCDVYTAMIKYSKSDDEKKIILAEFNKHKDEASDAYEKKSIDKKKARESEKKLDSMFI